MQRRYAPGRSMLALHLLAIAIATVAIWGCTGSVHSIIRDSALRFEPNLLGTWADSASRERAVVTQNGPRSYAVRYTDEQGHTVSMVARLGRSEGAPAPRRPAHGERRRGIQRSGGAVAHPADPGLDGAAHPRGRARG